MPTLGEDAGLVVDALGGLPGVQSARWLGVQTSFAEKSARLLELLEGVEAEKRTARFMCAIAVAQGERLVFEHEAACEGRVAFELRGSGGFGYDPIFYYPPLGKTTAELTPLEKLRVSHRGKAMAALKLYFQSVL